MANFLQAIGRTPPDEAAPDESTPAYTTSSASASELESEGVDSSPPRESERSSSLADPLAGPSSVGRRGRLAVPPRVAPSSVPKLGLATQAKVPEPCVGTLQGVQVAARRVLDLRRPRHAHIEGCKARLDAAVARLVRRQARYDRELVVEQRAALALEESENSALAIAPLLSELLAEVRYTNVLLRHIVSSL
ncbi:MAG: hypothetical protein M1840_002058 [Geoglossum simile]|nr:MAG: hypothetical protein M1840_002058 [Geoglossum simile]